MPLLKILALFHVSLGQQLHLFWLHKVLIDCFLVVRTSSSTWNLDLALLPFPQVGVSAALLATVSGVLSVQELWEDEWPILAVSLQVRLAQKAPRTLALHTDLGVPVLCLCSQSAAPFLHILALASITAGSWLVAGHAIPPQRSSKS